MATELPSELVFCRWAAMAAICGAAKEVPPDFAALLYVVDSRVHLDGTCEGNGDERYSRKDTHCAGVSSGCIDDARDLRRMSVAAND